jgi:hypothetical protein
MKRTPLYLFALCSTLAFGCQDRAEAGAPSAPEPAATAPAAEEGKAGDAPAAGRAEATVPANRKLIQRAELQVEIASYEDARQALDRRLAALGGFVADAKVNHGDGGVASATLVLRVPADKLAAFMSDASGFGRVLHESLSSEDVTDAYVDVNARLANARRLEARLLELVAARTDGVTQLLEVERELARVREQIERYEAQIKSYDNQVAMSTIKLELVTPPVVATLPPTTLRERLTRTLAGSWAALVGTGQAVLVLAVALLPWLLPLSLLGLGLRSLLRRARRRRAAQVHAAPVYAAPVYAPMAPPAPMPPNVAPMAPEDACHPAGA